MTLAKSFVAFIICITVYTSIRGGTCQYGKSTALVRKLTFTAWINQCLHSTGLRVHDLETDLDNGLVLLKILETLSPGKKMPGRLGLHENNFVEDGIIMILCKMIL